MRKQIKIVGISHKSGTNKAGKPYEFYLIHATYSDPDTEGIAVVSTAVPDDILPTIEIGKEYISFSHFYNGKECLDGIFPV